MATGDSLDKRLSCGLPIRVVVREIPDDKTYREWA